ncbi:MAG TPA: nitroreductase [Firmicutes bacterium]|nr:nitroreductase [Bacillota bacterium]
MDFLSLAAKRRSVRSYSAKPVEEEKLKACLEAARLAPSANNRQPWRLIVVKAPEIRAKLVEVAGGQRFVGEAPIVIAAVALDPKRLMRCQIPAYAVDVAIALDHLTLAAASLGLGTCWIGHFDQGEAKELLKVPREYQIVALTPLGYPAVGEERPRSRKPLDALVSWDVWS